ncbi:hypothetical protein CYJ99_00215 [Neisseria perflava]|uniref:Uncharacterized protein n=1 Tax=Neisseria perflava TaxID=33053 RepID=A0A9X7F4B8_NEIPE|nr:hypothetical protein [Neisseria perflava]PLA50779.1 hypothetical protein CYJ99_00215 [Neisseria perflava]WOS98381.1 hypothetical protein CYJ98_001635 [Neisseria perflava]
MGFFEDIFDLVGEGIDCVMDGVIAVGEFAEEHPVATSLAVNVATSGMAAWSNAGTIATVLGGTGVLGNTATTGVAISSLSGAAATNASLAALGGGALSVGGGGMALGTAVVAGTGAAVGSAAGGIIAHTLTSPRE